MNTIEQKAKKAQDQKELRLFRKDHGLCVRCGKADAIIGLTLCQPCREKHNAQRRKNDNRHVTKKKRIYKPLSKEEIAKKVEDNRKRREIRAANGLCTMCGKEKALPGLKTCKVCRIIRNNYKSGYFEHSLKWYENERLLGRL